MDDILFCSGALTEEIQKLMSMNVLCIINHEHAKQVDKDDEEHVDADFYPYPPSLFDDMMRLQISTKLKEIVFTIDDWTEEYAALSMM